ncbi:uncharacterized protein LOC126740738 isoform X2 [Anthonomus grandis grandis]|nr:uncharacterized protein LOC126740738 isoform X2 [Anthonomus grandis grandis]
MWEKTREDGSKKLKLSAVPTIFGVNCLSQSSEEELIEIHIEEENMDEEISCKNHKLLQDELNFSNTSELLQDPKLISKDEQAALLVQNCSILLVPHTKLLDSSNILENDENSVASHAKLIALSPSNGEFHIASPLSYANTSSSNDDEYQLTDGSSCDSSHIEEININSLHRTIQASSGNASKEIYGKSSENASKQHEINSDKDSDAQLIEKIYFICDKGEEGNLGSEKDCDESTNLTKKEIVTKYEKKCDKLKAAVRRYRSRLRTTQQRIQTLESLVKENRHTKLLNYLFNEDQIRALGKMIRGKSITHTKWSDDTIATSLKLKLACGNKGYEEVLRQKFPYPSIRTLQRAIAVPAEFKNSS